MESRNNILLILTDQHLFDALGCAGNTQVRTPNIDRIARGGLRFDNAYCPAPICGPARAAIFTGKYPYGNGEVHNYIPLKAGTVLVTDLLTHQGYRNALVGKLHLSPCVKSFGFHHKKAHDSPHALYERHEPYQSHYMRYLADNAYQGDIEAAIKDAERSERKAVDDFDFWMGYQWVDEKHHDTVWTVEESIEFIKRHDQSRPFFLNTSFFGPHHPYIPPAPWDSVYNPADIELPESYDAEMPNCPVFAASRKTSDNNKENWGRDGFRRLMAAYYGNIAMIDHYLGKLFDEMERLNLWDDTTIIFTADHGDFMGHYGLIGKGSMYDPSSKIPLLIKPAFSAATNKRISNVVNSIDLFGTIAELAGFENWKEYGDESRSLLPLFNGEVGSWRNETFSSIGAEIDKNCLSMYRQDNFKLIRQDRRDVNPVYELFDLSEHHFERKNLFDDDAFHQIAKSMTDELDSWLRFQRDRVARD